MRHTRYLFAGAAFVFALALAAGTVPAGAQVAAPYVHVFVDGQPVGFDVPPQIDNGRVLVPMRGVFERLGATVVWNDQTQTVLAQRGATSVSLVIGSPQAVVNGQAIPIDVPPMVVDGRTMVPLRFVSQTLGSTVNWDASSSTVTIASGGTAGLPPSQSYGGPAVLPPSQTYGPNTYGPNAMHVVGLIIAVRLPVDPGSHGMIVVRHDGTVSQYYVGHSTVITRVNSANGYGGSVAIGALRTGDTVDLIVSPDNVARRIRATYSY
ncbi:MAG TPA: copper amine oxidase N-terminal domain-containing protein [bacterium]|nr:copper amine oxidase N-terminal domain-containing protein [bacterium]